MRNQLVITLAALVAFAAVKGLAAGIGLKPGLWESRIVKYVVDGRDMTSQMAGTMSQMQNNLSRLPPEKRAQLEAMMKEHGALTTGTAGSARLCISPEMAGRNKPIVDLEGRCQPTKISQSGNHTTFEINCSASGAVMTGKGESTATGDVITSRVDMSTRKVKGETHMMHTETEMKFLGSDCGDVKQMPLPKAKP
jgi:Protein of unknown function (DUF3617)